MIGYLKGKIIHPNPARIIIDVNGVGYLVFISLTTFEKISDSKEVELFIHTNVKEDSITLYGFYEESEKAMFELLISVSGIGPKSALGILSGIRIDELKEAIASGNISRIVKAPGIGKKTAERLVLELRSKIDNIVTSQSFGVSFDKKNEAAAALSILGYNVKSTEKILRDILTLEPDLTLENLIKKALNQLSSF